MAFRVYTGANFSGLPPAQAYHAVSLPIIYENVMWPGQPAELSVPSQETLTAACSNIASDYTGYVCIDLERYNLGNQANADIYIPRYLQILDRFRIARPNARWGYYAIVCERNWYDAIAGSGAGYDAWVARNNFTQPIADAVDATFPSLYTVVDDQPNWATYAQRNIAEVYRLAPDLPCFPFIWPQHQEADPPYDNPFINGTFWRLQLDTLKDLTEGCVLWSSTTGLPAFDRAEEWWDEQLDFGKTIPRRMNLRAA